MLSPHHNDQELLARIRGGDDDAFAEIFGRYWYELYQQAHAIIRSREEAKEIVQDLFVTLWQKRESLHADNLPNYLYVSMRRKVIDKARSKLTQEKYWKFAKQHLPSNEETTAKMVAFDELSESLEEGIKKLPEKTQLIFRLNRLEGRSVAEISKYLKLSERAIEYHLTQSLRELRLHLKNFLSVIAILNIVLFL